MGILQKKYSVKRLPDHRRENAQEETLKGSLSQTTHSQNHDTRYLADKIHCSEICTAQLTQQSLLTRLETLMRYLFNAIQGPSKTPNAGPKCPNHMGWVQKGMQSFQQSRRVC